MFSAPVQSSSAQPRRALAGVIRGVVLRWVIAALLGSGVFAAVGGAAGALDEVVLKNGRRYVGTITQDSPTTLVLMLDGGTVEFPRSMIASPVYVGPPEPETSQESGAPDTEETTASPTHPLPGVADALRRLRGFSWATGLKQVPVLVSDQGRWQYLPCISFWVSEFFQLSFYGDPARPSAIELSLHDPPESAWEEKRRVLEFVLSLAPALAHDSRFDRLDVRGDQYAIGDLWFEVTSPENPKTPGRWTALLVFETSLQQARATSEDLLAISEPVSAATLDPTRPRSWQRASWLPDELEWVRQASTPLAARNDSGGAVETETKDRSTTLRPLGGERVYLRAFARERGRYQRTNIDWSREFAATR